MIGAGDGARRGDGARHEDRARGVTGPPAATAAVRVAVRRCLRAVDGPVAAAVSGGADSLALAAALAFERPGATALVVDHGLQPGSAQVAEGAAESCRGLGLDAAVLQASVSPAVDRRPPPAPPATSPSSAPPTHAGWRPSCWATRSTTRPRRCCSGWPGAAARGP
jgi:hypothetical protein